MREDQKEVAEAGPSSWKLVQFFPDIPADQHQLFATYFEELKKFNVKLNLVSAKTMAFADVIHYSDCINATRCIKDGGADLSEIYDFGSGNGFPGIVMAILLPKSKVNLVEIDGRKAEFLKHVVHALGMDSRVKVLNVQVEALPDNSVKCAVSRGFANLSQSILKSRKCFVKGGVYFHLKGEEWSRELSEIPSQLCSFWRPSLLAEYELPVGNFRFSVVKTEKIKD